MIDRHKTVFKIENPDKDDNTSISSALKPFLLNLRKRSDERRENPVKRGKRANSEPDTELNPNGDGDYLSLVVYGREVMRHSSALVEHLIRKCDENFIYLPLMDKKNPTYTSFLDSLEQLNDFEKPYEEKQ